MSQMDQILEHLNEVSGVRGAAIATSDGMLVAGQLNGRFREDAVSGLTSFVILTTRRAMADGGEAPELDRMTLQATHGKLIIERVNEAFLIVITDQFAQGDVLEPAVSEAAEKLRSAVTLGH